jgi:hypothetical protein
MSTDQQAPKKLTTPTCKKLHKSVITVDQIGPGEHGYNVYVKVLKTENSKVGVADRNVIYCTVGDHTAQARASGNVIAIRNGRSQVVKEQIELRIDV